MHTSRHVLPAVSPCAHVRMRSEWADGPAALRDFIATAGEITRRGLGGGSGALEQGACITSGGAARASDRRSNGLRLEDALRNARQLGCLTLDIPAAAAQLVKKRGG